MQFNYSFTHHPTCNAHLYFFIHVPYMYLDNMFLITGIKFAVYLAFYTISEVIFLFCLRS